MVENELDTAGLYKAVLESRGHEVSLTFDGLQCLKRFSESAYDIVMLDYKIPFLNGMQVAKQILAANPDQKIIFASSFVKEALVDSFIELRKVVGLLQKPFEPEVLIETVEEIAAGKLTKEVAGQQSSAQTDMLLKQLKGLQGAQC